MMPEKSTRLQAPRVPVWPSLKSRVALGAVAVLVLHALLAGFERRPDLPGVVRSGIQLLRGWTASETSPGDRIVWFDCPDSPNTMCVFFDVPLDHLNSQRNETVTLALRKYPATVRPSERIGTLFLNPGGPGGSGTEEVACQGEDISVLVNGRMDIVSFDPRGVNLTSPPLACFRSEALAQLFQRDQEHLGLLYESRPLNSTGVSSSITPAELRWAASLDTFDTALDRTCVERGNKAILEFSSTAIVARDLKLLMEAVGDAQLNFLGFSYGTILGATFAAMFPELVGRLVLDGVSDSAAYTNDFWEWGRVAVNHTHKTFDGFLETCIKAGPERCALASSNSTLASLHSRITSLRESLHAKPLPVSLPFGTGIVTASAIQHSIFRGMYAPRTWPRLAEALADAELGDGAKLYSGLNAFWSLGEQDSSKNIFGRHMDSIGSGLLCHSIMCSDTDPAPLADTSLPTLVRYIRDMGDRSITGEAWALWVAQCRRWSHHAKDVYRGPWTVADGLRKTRFPVLFISMTADPVTPLSAGVSMSQGFGPESASLLIQNGYGHCSTAMPSLCVAKAVQAYIVKGEVPPYGTTCESEPGFLFSLPGEKLGGEVGTLSRDDGKLLEALSRLSAKAGEGRRNLPLGL